MIKTGSLFTILSLFFFGIYVNAATTVHSGAERTEVATGETFNVTVSVVSTEDVNIQEPRIPELDGFELLNNFQTSAVSQKLVQTPSGMKFETQRRKEFTYTLTPTRPGNLSVSSFEVVVDGKIYRTKPILIQVGPGSGGVPSQGRPQRPQLPPGFDDPFEAMDQAEEEIFNQLLRQRQRMLQQLPGGGGGIRDTSIPDAAFRSLPNNPNEAFFISVEVDKTQVYEGEQVTVNWYIYTRGQMETLDRLKFPNLKGFWKEIIEEVPSIQFTEEIVNGIPWKKALLASHALFPIKAGTATVDDYRIKSRVRLPTQGFGGLFGKAYEFTKSSARVPIKVMPLPVEGRPSDFTGAVGQFEVHASVEGQSFPVNQPFSLRVRFEGAGNAKLIDLPAMNLPAGLEQYDTKSESKFFKNGRSYKEFEVLLIPRQEGEITLPELSVSMFDPLDKKYYTKKTQAIPMKIVNNPNAPVGASSRLADSGQPTKTEKKAELPDPILSWSAATESSLLTRPALWIALYGAAAVILLLKAQKEMGWRRRRRTLKEIVQKRYKKVDSAVQQGDYRKAGAEMTNIFYLVLGELAGSGGASLEMNRLMEMIPPSLRRDYGDQIQKEFEVFQTLSFAPDEMLGALKQGEDLKGHVSKGKKVIDALIAQTSEKTV